MPGQRGGALRVIHLGPLDERALQYLAARTAQRMQEDGVTLLGQATVLFLDGELGAGKTSFVRAMMRAFGVEGRIKSPTYTLVESYSIRAGIHGAIDFHHFDLYRIVRPEEWHETGFDEMLVPGTVSLIEWSIRAQDLLPSPDLAITVHHHDTMPLSRNVSLAASTERGRHWLGHLV